MVISPSKVTPTCACGMMVCMAAMLTLLRRRLPVGPGPPPDAGADPAEGPAAAVGPPSASGP
jgi:hypothetical protein